MNVLNTSQLIYWRYQGIFTDEYLHSERHQKINIKFNIPSDPLLIVGGTLNKVCNKINLESQFENLNLSSNKKVNMEGNKQQ